MDKKDDLIEYTTGKWYPRKFVDKASEKRIPVELWDREGVQRLVKLYNLAELLHDELEEAVLNHPEEFYTEAERDPGSPEYFGKVVEQRYPMPDLLRLYKGYKAAMYLMEAVQAMIDIGNPRKVSSDMHALEFMQAHMRFALKIILSKDGNPLLPREE